MAEGWTARLVLLVGLWVERRGPLGMAQWDEGERTRLCACAAVSKSVFFGYTHTHIGWGGVHKVSAKKAHRR